VTAAGYRVYPHDQIGKPGGPVMNELRSIEERVHFQADEMRDQFASDVARGLSASPKRLPSKYLYDETGSRLFKEIMCLQEYYPTKCELEIIRNHGGEIAEAVGDMPFNLVELGAGDGMKTKILLKQFLRRGLDFHYVPIDISHTALGELACELNAKFEGLRVEGIASEYFSGLRKLSCMSRRRNVVLFLGSNIGNFPPGEAAEFIAALHERMNDLDYLLIGYDLKKDIGTIVRAYNDSEGITARFNLNLLARINRELEGNFNPRRFRYYSTYNARTGGMESFLISIEKQSVCIGTCGRTFSFDPWESIHTESSYKYLDEDLHRLAACTGFEIVARFHDSNGYFTDALWRVRKDHVQKSGRGLNPRPG
jgi:L-histidine N-alpha-methyltransferase